MSTSSYKEKWQDPKFNDLFIGFKQFIATSEEKCAGQCAEIISQQLPNQIQVLDLGAGDGTVSLAFLETLSKYRQVSGYTAIDVSEELVKILNSKKKRFEQYSTDTYFLQADGTTFIPSIRPNLIVAFSSWFGIPLPEISRYLSILEPGGILAITLSSKASITIDLTIQFVEPMRSSEDIIEWLEVQKINYTKHEIISPCLERQDFINGKDTNPKAETFFRYLLREPENNINYIVPYLHTKSDLYFKTPKDLLLIEKQN
jgi:SAM-dependent methyltransferase